MTNNKLKKKISRSSLLFILLFFVASFRIAWLNVPEDALVFDEIYYVNAARKILSLPTTGRPGESPIYAHALAGTDPNVEHPPVAKLIIAAFIKIFGDHSWSFRFPSAILGSFAVLFLYLIVKKLGTPKTALFAAFLYSCENLTFVHSRIAMLDIYMVAFMLMGLYFYLDRRIVLSATLVALSALSKITGLSSLGIILVYSLFIELSSKGSKIVRLKRLASLYGKYLATFLLIFLGLLWLIDTFFVLIDNHHPNPIEHLLWMTNYSFKLRVGGYLWNGSVLDPETMTVDEDSIASPPWLWLINEKKILYYLASVEKKIDGRVIRSETVAFYGEMNPIIVASMIPSLAYLFYSFLKSRDKLSFFLIVWWLFTYIIYYPLAFMNRMVYIYYMCPAMPAVCASAAYMLHRLKLPEYILLAYSSATFMAFLHSFPIVFLF